MVNQTSTQGNRRVVVGGDVISSIINTGDHVQFFVGDYERLRDAYIEPWSVFERVDLDHFVGRERFLAKIDAFLCDNDRGYVILEAEAGLGKTSILAYLAKEWGCIHHFVELAPRQPGVAAGLKNLASQLVRICKLNPYLAEGVLPEAAARPDFLQNLLFKAAERLDDKPIVIVVDALDEAGIPSGQNALGLPRMLPKGVYLIVSQRPVPIALRVEVPRKVLHLRIDDEDNLTDMHHYLEKAATWPVVRNPLTESGYLPQQFIEVLAMKCKGHWIYLHHVVEEIRLGRRSPLDLETLPDNLWQYYEEFWQEERNEPNWYEIGLPMMSMLAAAQEAVSLKQLTTWAGVKPSPSLRPLLNERWRPFLSVEGESEARRYRLMFSSLREFLEGSGAPAGLPSGEESLLEELSGAVKGAHKQISDHYLAAWGGLDAELSDLLDHAEFNADDKYGIRHLVTHLEKAGRIDELHALLSVEHTTEQGQKANLWFEVHEHMGCTAEYLADVDRAWQLAEQEGPNGVGKQIRYALIRNSIGSLAATLSIDWLIALVKQGVWDPAKAIAHAQMMSEPRQRAETLATLATALAQLGVEKERLRAANEAWAALVQVPNQDEKAPALYTLIFWLPDDLIGDALDLARGFESPEVKAELLIALGTRLAPAKRAALIGEILETLQDVELVAHIVTTSPQRQILTWPQPVATAFAQLALQLPREELLESMSTLLSEAMVRGQETSHDLDRLQALFDLLPNLPRQLVSDVLIEALSLAKASRSDPVCIWALLKTTGWLMLHEEGWTKVADECLRTVQAIRAPQIRLLISAVLTILFKITPAISRAINRVGPLKRTRQVGRTGGNLLWRLLGRQFSFCYHRPTAIKVSPRVQLLVQLSLSLPTPEERIAFLMEAIRAAQNIEDASVRIILLARLALELPEDRQNEFVNRAFAVTEEITDVAERAQVLAGLAGCAYAKGRSDVIELARHTALSVEDLYIRALTLGQLLPYLAKIQRADILGQALEAIHEMGAGEDYRQAEVLILLAANLPNQPDRQPLLDEALELIHSFEDPRDQAELLGRVALVAATEAQEGYFRAAWEAMLRIKDPSLRAQAMVGLARIIPDQIGIPLLVQHWQTLQSLGPQFSYGERGIIEVSGTMIRPLLSSLNDSIWLRAQVLSLLPPEILRLVVSSPRIIGAIYNRVRYSSLVGNCLMTLYDEVHALPWLFVRLSRYLSRSRGGKILARIDEVMASQDLNSQAVTKISLLPFARPNELKEAITEAREATHQVGDAQTRAASLSMLAECIPDKRREAVLKDMLSSVKRIKGEDIFRGTALKWLITQLPTKLLARALRISDTILEDSFCAEVMVELIECLPAERIADLVTKALSKVQMVEENHVRADLLIRFAPYLPLSDRSPILQQALEATLAIKEKGYLYSDSHFYATRFYFGFSLGIGTREFGVKVGKRPVSELERWSRAFGMLRFEFNGDFEFNVLGHQRNTIEWQTGSEGSGRIWLETPKAFQLVSQAPVLAMGSQGVHVRGWLPPIGHFRYKVYSRGELLKELYPLCSPELLARSFEMIETMGSLKGQTEALVTLATHLPGERSRVVLDKAIELAQSIEQPIERVGCYVNLIGNLSDDQRPIIWKKAFEAAKHIEDLDIRMLFLVRLALDAPSSLRNEAWQTVDLNASKWADSAGGDGLALLAPLWVQAPLNVSYRLWAQVLRSVAGRRRSQLLTGLDALSQVIGTVGGEEATDETAVATLQILEWWP
jgi:hypothetical protein